MDMKEQVPRQDNRESLLQRAKTAINKLKGSFEAHGLNKEYENLRNELRVQIIGALGTYVNSGNELEPGEMPEFREQFENIKGEALKTIERIREFERSKLGMSKDSEFIVEELECLKMGDEYYDYFR